MMYDGKLILKRLAKEAGYNSIAQLVAKYSLFTHPETVKLTKNRNLFRIIRNANKRGSFTSYHDGKDVMFCDNEGPNRAFVWSNGGLKYSDVQFNHIYSDSQNVNIYTSLANICVTPAFIAKLTDTDDETKALLRYRSYDLYGFFQNDIPDMPYGYNKLKWKELCEPNLEIEKYLLMRMNRAKKSRSTISSREIGWYFSDYLPDSRILK